MKPAEKATSIGKEKNKIKSEISFGSGWYL